MKMRRPSTKALKRRSLTRIAAIAAVAVAAVIASGGGGKAKTDSAGRAPTASAPAGSQQLSFIVSPEKEQLLKAVVAKFNAAGQQVAGKRVFVSMKAMNSGDAESAIARGRLQPDVWSPAGSFWGRLLNLRADKPYVAQDNPSIVRTPLVIAMWEPMAQALGYPRKAVAFEDIVRLATDPRGWAAAGKPALRALQVRAHQPRQLDLRRRGGHRLLLRARPARRRG